MGGLTWAVWLGGWLGRVCFCCFIIIRFGFWFDFVYLILIKGYIK
jgi:hypothetical protein